MDATSASIHAQDLADRLTVATEEQDVLYMLYWLEKMKESNCLEQAINGKHSWKGYSALESIVQSPFTQHRRVILEVLLLQGADGDSQEIRRLAMKNENLEALEVLLTWKISGRDSARLAQHLLSLSLEEAAEWIDRSLPSPPNAATLTGCGDLPRRSEPSSAIVATSVPSSSMVESLSKFSLLHPQPPIAKSARIGNQARSFIPRGQSNGHATPANRLPTPPSSRPSSSFASPSLPDDPDESAPLALLHLSNLPIGFRAVDLRNLTGAIDVECRVLLYHTDFLPTYAFVHVLGERAEGCIKSLNAKIFPTGQRLGCERGWKSREIKSLQKLSSPHHHHQTPLSSLPPSSPRAMPTTASIKEDTHNVLFLNLPPTHSYTVSAFLDQFPFCAFLSIPTRNQSVTLVKVNTPATAQQVVALWNGFEIDGNQLEVVLTKERSSALAAANLHFNSPAIPRIPKRPNLSQSLMPFVRRSLKRSRIVETRNETGEGKEREGTERKRARG